MGHTGNMVTSIKDAIRQMSVALETTAYFGDRGVVHSNLG